jgi:Tfp pilus assembly pilus retraction ATPase PilT
MLLLIFPRTQHIRKNALQHLQQQITITRKQGSFTLEESLAQLVFQNQLGREGGMVRALHPQHLDVMLKAKGF